MKDESNKKLGLERLKNGFMPKISMSAAAAAFYGAPVADMVRPMEMSPCLKRHALCMSFIDSNATHPIPLVDGAACLSRLDPITRTQLKEVIPSGTTRFEFVGQTV